jgi:hypothetical protein
MAGMPIAYRPYPDGVEIATRVPALEMGHHIQPIGIQAELTRWMAVADTTTGWRRYWNCIGWGILEATIASDKSTKG